MKKSTTCTAIVVAAAILIGSVITNQTVGSVEWRQQHEILILQADQNIIALSNGLGQTAWVQTEFFVTRSSGSSGAPVYPAYTYGDVLRVSGHTNAIVSLAQTLADLRTAGWRLVEIDSQSRTYTLEK